MVDKNKGFITNMVQVDKGHIDTVLYRVCVLRKLECSKRLPNTFSVNMYMYNMLNKSA